jgi:hypothetical protein
MGKLHSYVVSSQALQSSPATYPEADFLHTNALNNEKGPHVTELILHHLHLLIQFVVLAKGNLMLHTATSKTSFTPPSHWCANPEVQKLY